MVGVICPWNLPLLLMTWKVGPALAAGNTVVVKPSEETPSTATLLAEVMDEIGMPAGVYNVVHGFGPDSAGQALVQHPDVAAITFTGESATGQRIMADASPTLKPLSFELGEEKTQLLSSPMPTLTQPSPGPYVRRSQTADKSACVQSVSTLSVPSLIASLQPSKKAQRLCVMDRQWMNRPGSGR